jgi:hypothetical protein
MAPITRSNPLNRICPPGLPPEEAVTEMGLDRTARRPRSREMRVLMGLSGRKDRLPNEPAGHPRGPDGKNLLETRRALNRNRRFNLGPVSHGPLRANYAKRQVFFGDGLGVTPPGTQESRQETLAPGR